MWTSGELAIHFGKYVKKIDQSDNANRLERHVYPVIFQPIFVDEDTTFVGFRIGDIPMSGFTMDHADYIINKTPNGLVPNVAAAIRRVCRLAVHPVKATKLSPLPHNWSPKKEGKDKEKSYLFPREELQLLNCTRIPLVRRVLYGFMTREGPRKENSVSLRWENLTLEDVRGGYIVFDETKNGRGGAWALDESTAEALRRWRKLCPSEEFVFPAAAMGVKARGDRPMYVDKLAAQLGDDLKLASVTRPKLFEASDRRLRLRAHDLRATFITISLANKQTEAWVQLRTGHTSSAMVNRYCKRATTAEELYLGPLRPMHRAIPELAKLGGDEPILAGKPAAEGDILVVNFERA